VLLKGGRLGALGLLLVGACVLESKKITTRWTATVLYIKHTCASLAAPEPRAPDSNPPQALSGRVRASVKPKWLRGLSLINSM